MAPNLLIMVIEGPIKEVGMSKSILIAMAIIGVAAATYADIPLAHAKCGDMKIQTGEECDPPSDPGNPTTLDQCVANNAKIRDALRHSFLIRPGQVYCTTSCTCAVKGQVRRSPGFDAPHRDIRRDAF